ncbi:hypothetical protein F8S09_01215 [Deinococcus sp. SDU3-2]|uniref:Lipoprotein n=1 Tax=Deinococcus terrestris TaxID=2651870 RepID=A0A7X1NTU4_9DEIO|nr:hypothetical protein [Deinococcus terrestris]MPY65316.1 hypothetical protein [Deinococcus terrestris]
MRVGLPLVLLGSLGVFVGCTPAPSLPPLPPVVLPTPDELYFGTATGSLDTAAWTRVFDHLKPRHPRLRLKFYLLPRGTRVDSLKAHYDAHLLPEGWGEVRELPTLPSRGSWAFGYRKGKYVFAVVGLNERYVQEDRVPMNVLTDLPDPPAR